LKTIKAD